MPRIYRDVARRGPASDCGADAREIAGRNDCAALFGQESMHGHRMIFLARLEHDRREIFVIRRIGKMLRFEAKSLILLIRRLTGPHNVGQMHVIHNVGVMTQPKLNAPLAMLEEPAVVAPANTNWSVTNRFTITTAAYGSKPDSAIANTFGSAPWRRAAIGSAVTNTCCAICGSSRKGATL